METAIYMQAPIDETVYSGFEQALHLAGNVQAAAACADRGVALIQW